MAKRKKIEPKITDSKEELRLLEIASEIKKENKQVDFKEKFDPTNIPEWCQIIKDIIAMANSGGGAILFGIKDNESYAEELNSKAIMDIDPATIADKIYSYTNEHFSEVRILEILRQGKTIPIFLIGPAAIPIVFTKPGADVSDGGKQRPAFVRGSVYFRHGAKSEPGNTNDLKQALERAINKTKRSWFEGVRRISNIKAGDEVIVKTASIGKSTLIQKVPGKIVSDANAASFRPDNASEIWPNRAKELIKKVNEGLPTGKKITSHDLLCIKKKHEINETNNPDFVYKPYRDLSPRYSDTFVDWLIISIKKTPTFLEVARKYYRQLKGKD